MVSVVTLGELRAGVLAAAAASDRADRLVTLRAAESLEPLVVDDAVADAWARLRVELRDLGRRMPANDSWIAATAIAHGLPVATPGRGRRRGTPPDRRPPLTGQGSGRVSSRDRTTRLRVCDTAFSARIRSSACSRWSVPEVRRCSSALASPVTV